MLTLQFKEDHPKDLVLGDMIVARLLNQIKFKSLEVLNFYADAEGSKREENEIFQGHRFVSGNH